MTQAKNHTAVIHHTTNMIYMDSMALGSRHAGLAVDAGACTCLNVLGLYMTEC